MSRHQLQQVGWTSLACLGLAALSGCGNVCGDDGLVWKQQDNPACNAQAEGSATDPTKTSSDETTIDPTHGTDDPTTGGTDTATMGGTDSATMGGTDTATMGGGLNCKDSDGDGFGDPETCMDQPFPGSVPNNDDCNDADKDTFPGAAENDSPTACMQDADGDGFGDSTPADPGTVPGTDCDDTNMNTFPGAAPNDGADTCNQDNDGDDWGDDMPPDGVDPGSDCNDADAEVHIDCTDCTPGAAICADATLITCNARGTDSDMVLCEFGCDDAGQKCWGPLEVDAGPTVCIEFGASTPLQATVTGGDGDYAYDWTPIETLDDPKISGPIASPTGPTSYGVNVVDGEGNMASDSVSVYINNLPLELNPDFCETYDFPWAVDKPTKWAWDDPNKELCQTVNGKPSALFCGWDLADATVKGTFRVNKLDNDDDFIGFMWGIQDTDHFYLFTWKRLAQDFGVDCGGNVPQGMVVKAINVADPMMDPETCADLHAPNDTTNSKLILAPADFGNNTGWAFDTDYLFELTHKLTGEMNIVVRKKADDSIVAQKTFMDTTYASGKFGQYTYSQVGACFSDYKTSCIE